VRVRSPGGRVLVVAHRGVPGLAPENSLEGIDAALERDVDLVEVDVSQRFGELVLAHSAEVAGPRSPRLGDALAFLAERAAPEVGIQLDLKARGKEAQLAAEVRRHGLLDRTLVSSNFPAVLRALRVLEPTLATGLGYPYDRARVAERGLVPQAVVRAALMALRATLPARVVRMAGSARADLVALHHLVVSASTVSRCHARGIAVFAWTVNDAEALERVVGLGVDGVVTDEPNLVRP
jgi:glycerophosphoryl diester phosphodiesterase